MALVVSFSLCNGIGAKPNNGCLNSNRNVSVYSPTPVPYTSEKHLLGRLSAPRTNPPTLPGREALSGTYTASIMHSLVWVCH